MNLFFLGRTLETLGTVLIAVMALGVHRKVWKQQTITQQVLREMKLEQNIGIAGVVLVILGYILQVFIRLN